MKAITVRQPWAWAIVHAGKDVENRTQAWTYRGPLAVHAGLARPSKTNMASRAHRAAHGTEVPTPLAFGAIVGVVDLVDVHQAAGEMTDDGLWVPACCDSEWAELEYGETDPDFDRARRRDVVHLVLADPQPLAQPIPCRGALGLWTPSHDVLVQLEAT